MKFGLFYELSVPRPWTGQNTKKVYDNCLEQIRLADELGFDQVWAVEHHFLGEQSHSSAPELFLTACALQTTRIQVGHGIVVCVPQVNHPVRVAERAAVLDILSNGRLQFGTGRSSTWMELGGFGANPDLTKESWNEYVRAIPKMWTQERFQWEGKSFSMPERAVLPKPLQQPHPPMWVAVTSPGTELDAADCGLGFLGVTFGTFEATAARVSAYRERIKTCEPVGSFVNEQVNIVSFLYCHPEDEIGVREGKRMSLAYNSTAGRYLSPKEVYPGPAYASNALLRGAVSNGTPNAQANADVGLCIGDPERIADAITQWEAAGVDRLVFLMDWPEIIPQQDVLASMRLFAKEVMPRFTSHKNGANGRLNHSEAVAAPGQPA